MKEGYPRSSYIFYESFLEAILDIPDEDKLTILMAISKYALYGEDPDLKGFHKSIFILIKPQIDANQKKFVNGQKGAEYGIKGGRKPQDNPMETPQEPQPNPMGTPNVNDNVNDNVNVNEKKKTKVFIPPSLEEFHKYFSENGFSKELAERVFKGYEVNNWKDSRDHQIKNWKQKCQMVWFKPENKQPNGKQSSNEVFTPQSFLS